MNPLLILGALGAALGVVLWSSRQKAEADQPPPGGGGGGDNGGGGSTPVLVAVDDLVIS